MRSARVFYFVLSTIVIAGSLIGDARLVNAESGTNMQPVAGQLSETVKPIITEIQVSGDDEFVELYNPTESPMLLTGLSLWYRGSGTVITQLVNLNTIVLPPKEFAVFGHITGATITSGFVKASLSLNDSLGEIFIGSTASTENIIDKVSWGNVLSASGYVYDGEPALTPPKGKSLQRCFVNNVVSVTNPRSTRMEFLIYDNDLPTPFSGMNCIALPPPMNVIDCKGIVINEIGANIANQFIELYNVTDTPIQLAGCKLQTNRSSKTYGITIEELAAGEYRAISIADSGLTLTKTTTGTVYLLSSDGQTEDDAVSYSNLIEDTSWSRFVDGWRQTYTLTAGSENVDQPYLPCSEGYYRNLTTGRCNLIAADAPLIVCTADQYRNPETGRCKKIEVVTQTPCRDDQYRSEETHRCRNVVTASLRKPCKDNQYRSEETGRCRNLPAASVPDVAFAVQPVKSDSTVFVGWWALGGVGLLALGYGVWEWRREITSFMHQFIAGLKL